MTLEENSFFLKNKIYIFIFFIFNIEQIKYFIINYE